MVGDFDDVAGEAYPLVNMDEIGLQTLEEGIDHALDKYDYSGAAIMPRPCAMSLPIAG